jgi:hypothetical protein
MRNIGFIGMLPTRRRKDSVTENDWENDLRMRKNDLKEKRYIFV